MVFNIFPSICYCNIILMLAVYFEQGRSASLDDLKVVFMYEFPFDFSIKNLPPDDICTSVGVFSKHLPAELSILQSFYEEIRMNKISNKPRPTVFVFTLDLFPVSLDGSFIKKADILSHLEFIVNFKEQYLFDVLILDFLERNPLVIDIIDEAIQIEIGNLLSELKEEYPDLIIGLMVYNNADKNKEFMLDILDQFINFYVVASFDYTPCNYEDSEDLMAPPPTTKELETTVTELVEMGFKIEKLFLTIELVAKSWKNDDEDKPERWPYSHMCEATPGKRRRHCTQSLKNLYQQASIISKLKVKGVFIRSADLDDWKETCECGKFPAIKAITDGLTQAKEDKALLECTTFGVLAG